MALETRPGQTSAQMEYGILYQAPSTRRLLRRRPATHGYLTHLPGVRLEKTVWKRCHLSAIAVPSVLSSAAPNAYALLLGSLICFAMSEPSTHYQKKHGYAQT